jgi:hypothetical protein
VCVHILSHHPDFGHLLADIAHHVVPLEDGYAAAGVVSPVVNRKFMAMTRMAWVLLQDM